MEENNKNKQNKQVIIFAVILSFISIGILVFGFMMVSSSKVMILQSISNLYNKLDTKLDLEEMDLIDKINSSKNVGIKNEIIYKDDDNTLSLNTNLLDDNDLEKTTLELGLTLNKKELVDGKIALNDNKLYMFLKDITPSYYYTNFNYIKTISTMSSNNYEKILSLLKESIDEIVKEDDIKKSKEIIKLNNKEKNVNKLTVSVTKKHIYNILTKYINKIKKDKSLKDELISVLNTNEKDLYKYLDELLKYFNNSNEEVFEYNVYYYGFNKIVMYDFKFNKHDINIIYKIDDSEHLIVNKSSNNITDIEFKSDKTFNIKIKNLNLENEYKITGKYKDNEIELKYNKFKLIITKSVDDYKYNYTFKLYKNDKLTKTLNLITEYYFNKEINIDIKDSKNILLITEDEKNIIKSNIEKTELYNQFNNIFNNYINNYEISNLIK